jgi:hypothetical protein
METHLTMEMYFMKYPQMAPGRRSNHLSRQTRLSQIPPDSIVSYIAPIEVGFRALDAHLIVGLPDITGACNLSLLHISLLSFSSVRLLVVHD